VLHVSLLLSLATYFATVAEARAALACFLRFLAVLSKFLNDVEVSLAASSLSSCDGPETTSLSLLSYLGRLRDGVSNLGAAGILSFGASNFGREGISNFGLDRISNFGTENDGTSTFGASIFVMLNDGISSFGTSTFGSSNFGMLSDGISTLGVSNLGFDTFRVSKLGRDGSSNSNSYINESKQKN